MEDFRFVEGYCRPATLRDAADELDRLQVELHQDGMEIMNLRNELASLKQMKVPPKEEFYRLKKSIRDARKILNDALGE